MQWALHKHRYLDNTRHLVYRKKAQTNIRKIINETPNRTYVFTDIKIGDEVPVRVVYELFTDVCPKTCDNFRKICNQSYTNKEGEKLKY